MAVASALALWLGLEAGGAIAWPVVALGLLGSAGVAVSLLWPPALTCAIALLGASYALLLAVDDPPLDGRASLLAAGLVVASELSGWSIELRTTSPDEPGLAWQRAVWIATEGIGAVALTGAILAIVDFARADGVAVEALGAAAALAALALIARVAARGADG